MRRLCLISLMLLRGFGVGRQGWAINRTARTGISKEAAMAKKITTPTLAETAFGLRNDNPVSRMLAGFTGLAVAVTLILATVLPVEADRVGVCELSLDTTTPTCTSE